MEHYSEGPHCIQIYALILVGMWKLATSYNNSINHPKHKLLSLVSYLHNILSYQLLPLLPWRVRPVRRVVDFLFVDFAQPDQHT